MNVDLSRVPVWLLAIAVVLVLVQITLDVIALLDLYRRPRAEIALMNKPFWTAVILLLSIVGAVLYLVIGRRRPVGEDAPAASPSMRPADVADALYRRREKHGQT